MKPARLQPAIEDEVRPAPGFQEGAKRLVGHSQVSSTVSSSSNSSNTPPRKPVQRSEDLSGIRPAAFVLRSYGERLYREWKQGKRIRRLARNFGTTVDVIEDVLRETAA